MFSFYLLAFAFLAPFQDAQTLDSTALVCDSRRSYSALLDDNNETTPFGGGSGDGAGDLEGIGNGSDDDTDDEDQPGTTLRNRPQQQLRAPESRLSESIFVPIKDHSATGFIAEDLNHTCNHSRTEGGGGAGGQSGSVAESSDEEESSVRSVRFNRMAEVREMSSLDAPDALLARLSYSASLRIRRQKSHHKTARTALLFAVLVRNSESGPICE